MGVSYQLRELLPEICFDISKLVTFVDYKKDRSVHFSIPQITSLEVKAMLGKLNPNNSTGVDVAGVISSTISKLIYYSITNGTFPRTASSGNITTSGNISLNHPHSRYINDKNHSTKTALIDLVDKLPFK